MQTFKTQCWVFSVFLAISLLFSGPLAPAEGALGPKIVLQEYIYNFGEVLEGAVVDHAFKVFNQGDQILEIKSVKPG